MQLINTTDAVALIEQGEVIAYPTEAVWGLGCDPHDVDALHKLFLLKGRSSDKGLVLVASQWAQVSLLLQSLPEGVQHKIMQSWQLGARPTTWLVPHMGLYNDVLTGGRSSVAIRLCHHPVVQQLCDLYGRPIVSTSANLSGQPAALTLAEVQAVFAERVAYLPGVLGNSPSPSRIIDALSGEIIRA